MDLQPSKPGSMPPAARDVAAPSASTTDAPRPGPGQARRAALEAQKQYMDHRFGRDRPAARRRPA